MAALDLVAAAAALKVYYSSQRVQQLTYKDAPLYAMIPKHKDFYGKSMPLPMRVTNPQGRSAAFAIGSVRPGWHRGPASSSEAGRRGRAMA